MHICPRCATPLSNFEVTQGYKDIKDLSVTAMFRLLDHSFGGDGDVFVLAWTTTPWTLPGNALLAVGGDITYVLVRSEDHQYVVAKERLADVFDGKTYEVVDEFKGSTLVGTAYEPLFPYFADKKEGSMFTVAAAEFVTTEDGTGIVHIAPAFGADDYELCKELEVPFIQHVTMTGLFTDDVTDFAGVEVKQKGDHMATDIEMVKWLAHHDRLFAKKKYEHSYPHCWRCDTPLLNYATSSWFIEVTKVKEALLKNNQKTTWVPDHMKDGRFGKWLEGVRDWAVSRNRYWGTPLPIWKSEDGDVLCIGSVAELESYTGETYDDLHKHLMDPVVIEKDGKTYRLSGEVFDCWFESGSMPYAQVHYPFSTSKEQLSFPGDFIAEGSDQTRGWFYTLHVLATMLSESGVDVLPVEESPAFRHVVVNGTVLAEDGKKMSKSLRNYPDPMLMVDAYGADAVRYYLLSSPIVHGENLNFSEDGLREVYGKISNTLANVLAFYELFADDVPDASHQEVPLAELDRWMLARLRAFGREVTAGFEAYEFASASRPVQEFLQDLSQWYVRRNRARCKQDACPDRDAALLTMKYVLGEFAKLIAPMMPFLAEHVYQVVHEYQYQTDHSVHLEAWPVYEECAGDPEVLEQMAVLRKAVEMGLSLRKETGIRVRQPLAMFAVSFDCSEEYAGMLAEELNVKQVFAYKENLAEDMVAKEDGTLRVVLSTHIDDELRAEGGLRELVRLINQQRKQHGFTRDDRIVVTLVSTDPFIEQVLAAHESALCESVLADRIDRAGNPEYEATVHDASVKIGVAKVA
jgi:isoleucyl-tRNA synthetase